ncbi:hypothetical protein RMCBS344292_16223 [Rhizopus microsporus]|nr:hypothetical protein RMCBS344292_16223 [Rhizopus microsporus]
MNLLESCLSRRTGSQIHLSDDDDNVNDNHILSFCCLLKRETRGEIHLPEENNEILDFDVIRSRQEQDLNEYSYGLSDWSSRNNKGSFRGNSFIQSEYSPLAGNHSQTSSLVEEEEDAQFLSEQRISAIIDDGLKLNSAHIYHNNNVESAVNHQDLLDIALTPQNINKYSSDTENESMSSDEQSNTVQETSVHITESVLAESPKDLPSIKPCSIESSSSRESTLSEIDNPIEPNFSTDIDFPTARVAKLPYQPVPPMTIGFKPSSSISTPVYAVPNQSGTRRPSVVAAAQNLLGDKLDDFTEKLAIIKRNIINNVNNDTSDLSDDESVDDVSNHYYDYNTSDQRQRPPPWDTFISKFNKQASPNTRRQLFPLRRSVSIDDTQNERRLSNFYEEDELFDLNKIVAISKNVRTFSEEVVGNGIRTMFNNISTRIKNVQLPSDEE